MQMISNTVMFIMMFISGLLSSMSVWSDKWSDARISFNDIYMALLMSFWMLFFMAAWMKTYRLAFIGFTGILATIFAIRTQLFVNAKQYAISMIPHHSMAVMMSKRVIQYPMSSDMLNLVQNIISTQEKEVQFLKRIEHTTGYLT